MDGYFALSFADFLDIQLKSVTHLGGNWAYSRIFTPPVSKAALTNPLLEFTQTRQKHFTLTLTKIYSIFSTHLPYCCFPGQMLELFIKNAVINYSKNTI